MATTCICMFSDLSTQVAGSVKLPMALRTDLEGTSENPSLSLAESEWDGQRNFLTGVDQTSIRHGARGNLCFEKSDFSYRMDVAVAMKLPSCRLFAIGIKQRIPFWRFCAGTIGIWIAKVAHTYIHFKGMVYLVMILSNRNHIRRGCKTFLGLG